MLNRSVLLPLFVGASTLCWSLSQAQPQTAPVEAEAPMTANARVTDDFAPVTAAIRDNNLTEAEKILRKMKADGLKADQFNRWETLAARVALRQGDSKWLKEINEGAGLGDNANELLILGALRFILAADLKQARTLLTSVQEPDQLAEIPKRRYLQLWMRLEQLSGNAKAERQWAERLVDFAAQWDSPTCRSCHDNPKTHPGEVSTLDLKGWWVGDRFIALLVADGDAQAEASAAQTKLTKNPKDGAARLRLAYALRALNKPAESDEQLRTFPWTKFPDRKEKKPLRFTTFP